MDSRQDGHSALGLPAAREQLRRLAGLPAGWDSYGGAPIGQGLIEAADKLLGGLAQAGLELPALVPGPDGSLALEWHRPDRESSITLSGNEGHFRAGLFLVTADGQEREEELGDLDTLKITTLTALIAQLGRSGAEPLAQLEEERS